MPREATEIAVRRAPAPALAGSDHAPAAPATLSAMGLVQYGLENNVDVQLLERLIALQERVAERDARAAFFEAKAAFQEQVPEIRKSSTAKVVSKRSGTSFTYTYASLEEIARTIREPLRANGLTYSFDAALQGSVLVVSCVLRHVEGHEDRASFPVPIDDDGRMSAAQANGAALTYGRRQSLIAVLGLTAADEDKDGADARTGSAEVISERQAVDLVSLMDEVNLKNRPKFLEWLGAASVAEIRVRDYPRAVAELERRRGQ